MFAWIELLLLPTYGATFDLRFPVVLTLVAYLSIIHTRVASIIIISKNNTHTSQLIVSRPHELARFESIIDECFFGIS
jgi:hypothetical protein